MKNILVILSILLIGNIHSQTNKMFSLVIAKLENDNKSFEQFVYLGKEHCLDSNSKVKKDVFSDRYLSLFNSLYPFPRLIDENVLKQNYSNFEKKYLNIKKTKCSNIYSSENKHLRVLFTKIVREKKSYHNNQDYYLEDDMKDYLKYYMMNPKRFE